MTSISAKVKTMKAAVYKGPKQIKIDDLPYPEPGFGEVTVKVHCCGICGTDNHIFEGDYIANYPIVGGHEFSGTVFEIGEGVQGWEVGERVSVDPSVYCGNCYHCRNNQFNHCNNWNAIGVTFKGAFAEYVKVPAKNLYKIKSTMTFEEGALVEPMSCVAYALERTNVKFGDKVVIFGGGPMGLMLVQAIKVSGASEIVLVDIDTRKLELGKQFGATSVYLNNRQLSEFIGPKNYPYGFDIVVDATGVPAVIERMFDFAGPGARILQFGVTPNKAKVSINPFELYHKDWNYLGTMALKFNFNQAMFMVEEKRVNVENLVTRKCNLEEFVELIVRPKSNKDCKILVYPSI